MNTGTSRAIELGRLARDFAKTKRARTESARSDGRATMVDRLGSLHGLPRKLGQILALNELSSSTKSFRELTESPGPLPVWKIATLIERALGRHCSDAFNFIDPDGVAASMSQVHFATTRDGRSVAVKVLLPGIRDAIRLDLRALGWLTAPIGRLKKGFDLAAYRREVGAMLAEESDFLNEAGNLRTFGNLTQEMADVEVPSVFDDLSSDGVLTMSWIAGERFSDAMGWGEHERLSIAHTLVELFVRGIFSWGMLHADPHPGNYRFTRGENPVVGLIDFGCVKRIAPEFRDALAGLIRCGESSQSNADLGAQWERLGFDRGTIERLGDRIVDVTKILTEPFQSECFIPEEWNLADRLGPLLGEERMAFRTAGSAEMIYFVRAMHGLIEQLRALRVPTNWIQFVDTMIQGMPCVPSSSNMIDQPGTAAAESLFIHVREGDITKVKLSFGASAAAVLPDLIPEDLRPELEVRSIDLRAISDRAVASDFEPCELFSLREGEKDVRVWLE